MRDIAVLALFYGLLPFVPFRPMLGLLMFSWLAYMRPQDIAWGLGNTRLSMLVMLATLVGMLLQRERFVTLRMPVVLMGLLLAWVGITVQTSVLFEPSKERYVLFAKIVLVSALTAGLVRTRERFRLLLLTVAFSLGLLGLKYGLWGLLRGGARISHGPGGFMGDNNGFALALNMAIPLLVAVALTERSVWLRVGAGVLAAFTITAVIFTFSRGGLLTLAVIGLLLVIRSGRPVTAVILLALAFGGLWHFTSESFQEAYVNRAESIGEYEEDRSAMDRINAWTTALTVAREYPILGVGPANFMMVYRRFGDPDSVRVVHNAYLQWLTDSGMPALLLFVAMLGVSIARLWKLERSHEESWVKAYSRGLAISFVGYMVGAMLLDKAYYDLLYHLVGMTVALEVAAGTATVRSAGVVATLPWWGRQPNHFPST